MSLERKDRSGNARALDAATHALQSVPSPVAAVRVYACSLDREPDEILALATLLSPYERERMARFGSDQLRDRYAVGRASLRLLLGKHLGTAPATVAIAESAGERPRLGDRQDVDFNVSHTESLAVFAIAAHARVGIDIEKASRRVRTRDILRRYMTVAERAGFDELSDEAARVRVLQLWTCKEALSKATGDGVRAPFGRMDIAIEPVYRLVNGPSPYDSDRFTLVRLDAPAGFIAALALWRSERTPR